MTSAEYVHEKMKAALERLAATGDKTAKKRLVEVLAFEKSADFAAKMGRRG